MKLEFKPDFDHARAAWDRYWSGQLTPGPMMAIEVPRPGVAAVPPPGGGDLLRDLPAATDRLLAWAASREFLGGAVPAVIVQFGPDHFASCLGATMEFNAASGDTSWIVPFVADWKSADIRFQPESWCWRKTVACVRCLRSRCDGKLVVSGPNLQGGLDCLSAIRGPERLAMDLVECPEDVQQALRKVDAAYDACLAAIVELCDVRTWGMITRHGLYSTGTINIPQCDFSCMISPAMFRDFGLPSVRHEARALDAAEYHLDGPDAIKHLEAVASVNEIKAIQWQPGAGRAATEDWAELLQRIDGLGKGVLIYPKLEDARAACARYRSPHVFVRTQARTRNEAALALGGLQS